jgi:hypothetical protein
MNDNRNAGAGTGGESSPEIVELFADCATDVHMMMDQRQRKQAALAQCGNVAESSRKSAYDMSAIDDMGDPALQDEPVTWKQKSWHSGFSKMLRKSKDPQEEESNKIKNEIADLNKAIQARKSIFGIEIYNAMIALGEGYQPTDATVAELFAHAKKDISGPQTKMDQAKEALQNSGSTISHDELKGFVNTHPQIWAMLSVNCQIEEEQCKEVAFRVALELVSGKSGHDALDTVITKNKFKRFQKRYIKDGKGHQEFFHRTVFMAFDEDWNGVLDRDETDKFLDTFYISGSIFQGDARLPEKEELKVQILEQLDENGDGMFSFDEIRSLISGLGDRSSGPRHQ